MVVREPGRVSVAPRTAAARGLADRPVPRRAAAHDRPAPARRAAIACSPSPRASAACRSELGISLAETDATLAAFDRRVAGGALVFLALAVVGGAVPLAPGPPSGGARASGRRGGSTPRTSPAGCPLTGAGDELDQLAATFNGLLDRLGGLSRPGHPLHGRRLARAAEPARGHARRDRGRPPAAARLGGIPEGPRVPRRAVRAADGAGQRPAAAGAGGCRRARHPAGADRPGVRRGRGRRDVRAPRRGARHPPGRGGRGPGRDRGGPVAGPATGHQPRGQRHPVHRAGRLGDGRRRGATRTGRSSG